jgi:protein SCO1/2
MNKTAPMLWIVVLITFAAASVIWYRAKTRPPVPEEAIRAEEPARPAGQVEPKKIEDFALTDSEEMEFDTRDLRGHVWVASFFFATCPSICRQQNQMVGSLYGEYGRQGVKFACITCDPENDTPEKLRDYAKLYDADPEDWFFLTGEMSEIETIGEGFQLAVSKRSHAERLVVIDQWGWLRGMYDWHQPEQMAAMKILLDELVAEEASPHETPDDDVTPESTADRGQWLQEFTLTERSGEPFHSQDMLGQIWVTSFFFTTCASTCRAQNDLVNSLYQEYGRKGVRFVCITCDPETDTAEQLREYAKLYDAHPDNWLFLTGELPYIRRVGAEWFEVPVDKRAHVDRLIVVDQQGEVRDRFDWHEPLRMKKMKQLLDELLVEAKS